MAERIPCIYDVLLDCPESCKLHKRAAEEFRQLVTHRNNVFNSSLTSEQVLEEKRKIVREYRRGFLLGVVLVVTRKPETKECEQRENILLQNTGKIS